MKIRTKLSFLLITITTLVVFAVGYFSIATLENYFRERMINELKTHTTVFEELVRHDQLPDSLNYEFIQHLAHTADIRLTLITGNGIVVFESDLPSSRLGSLENHKDRPEVAEALTGEFGSSTRHSATLNIDMLYLAKHIADTIFFGATKQPVSIVRVGLPLTAVQRQLSEIRAKIIFVSSILLIVVIIASFLIARRMTVPIQEMNATVLKIRGGDLNIRIPVTTNDELGQLAETLNTMIDRLNNDIVQLKKLERVRSEFLGNVSHELRTPIFTIQGMLETLLNGALEDPAVSSDFVARALRNTKRLGTLLNDLIEISRIESGDMKMSFRYFDVDEFLSSIVAEYQQEASGKNISLRYIPPPQHTELMGDRERLRQVMVNLIDNALKYTAVGGTVIISVELGTERTTICVRDSGMGIAPEHLPRIFERFYRVDKERSRDAGGTGLGLAIVKHIIEAHGSTVQVESELGKGTAFKFSLKK